MNERFKGHITRCIILLFIPAIAALTSCKDNNTYVEFSEIVGNEEYTVLEDSEHENTRETYERFLNGELTVEWERKQISISELFWDNDIEYCFWDIDGDNSEELHIRSDVVYYAIKVQDKTPQIIFEGWWSDEPVVTDKLCGIMDYVHHYGYEEIEFIQINADGGKESDGLFYWLDKNNNGNIDEEDSFHISGRKVYEDIDMEQYVQYKEEQIAKKTGNELKWTSKRLKNFETWQEAYIDFIHKMQVTELVVNKYGNYSLIYVDADDIPELYIDTGCSGTGEIIVSFYEGNIRALNRDRIGMKYIQYGGLLYNELGVSGLYPCNIYTLEKGVFSEIGTGWYKEHVEDQEIVYYDFFGRTAQ